MQKVLTKILVNRIRQYIKKQYTSAKLGLPQECKVNLTLEKQCCLLHSQANNHCNAEKVSDKIWHSSLSKLG